MNSTGKIPRQNSPVLVRTFLKLDFRNSGDSGSGRFVYMVTAYLLTNFLLMISFFLNSSRDKFVLLTLSVNFFLVSFILLSEYPGLFFSSRYGEILSSLPVKQEEMLFSKAVSGMLYLSVFPFTLALPQSVYFYFYDRSAAGTMYYFLASLLFSYLALGFILLANSLFVYFARGRSKLPLILLQVLFMFFVIFVNRLISTVPGDSVFAQPGILKYLPQYIFLLSFSEKIYLVYSAGAAVLIYLAAYIFLRSKYAELSGILNDSRLESSGKKPLNLLSQILKSYENLFVRNKTGKAAFYLVKNVLRNSTVLKLRVVILTILPLIVLGAGLILNYPEMIYIRWNADSLYIVSPSVSITVLMSLRLIISGFKLPADRDINIKWIYESVPVADRVMFLRGVVKYAIIYHLIPVTAIAGIMLAVKMPAADVLINMLYLLSFAFLFTEVFIRIEKTLPFTADTGRFSASSRYTDVLTALLSGTVYFVSQIIVFKNVIFTVSAVIIFLFIYFVITKLKIINKNT